MKDNKIGAKGVYYCKDCLSISLSSSLKRNRAPCVHCLGSVEYFSSRREYSRWRDLTMLAKSGAISNLQCHPKFKLVVNGVNLGTYTADSRRTENHIDIVEDVKGYMNSAMKQAFKLRIGLMLALYGVHVEVYK